MTKHFVKKNLSVSDAQRQKYLTRRILEERAAAEEIWRWMNSRSLDEKLADYIKTKTVGDHITGRILRGIIAKSTKHGAAIYPITPEQKYYDKLDSTRISQHVMRIREFERFGYLSVGTEIPSVNPVTRDLEYVVCNLCLEQKNPKKKSRVLIEWETDRIQNYTSRQKTTAETVKRAMLPKKELEKIHREDMERRKRRGSQ